MGVVNQKSKAKKELKKQENNVANGKPKNENEKVKKKKKVSCLQCIKPNKNDGGLEGKYRVAAPELMQDTFMSDSEDEGGEVECPIQQQQQYRYMNSEAGTLHRAKPLEDSVTDGHLWPSNNDKKVATIDRQPLDIGFLVSFVVDARGGAMKAKRRGGVRIIVPPAACAAPTRVTCRAATRRAPAAAPPPLMEGEALASRLLELQPQGAKFLAPVIIEVPIFTSSCREREIVILRSDTGETWQDHYLHNNDNPMIQEALQRERQEHGNTGETLGENGERVTRIVTCDFPHYLAVVSRVRQEVHIIGPEGGTVSSAHIPQVQAQFPAQALTKRIRVGLQAHGASPELVKRLLPRHAGVSPVITVEPRRRKFHRSITLTAPLPIVQGGQHDKQGATLRLLCSIMGGQARAVWEDVTGSTPLTLAADCASFTTTVSARFWLMNCQNVSDATKLATELYRDMLLVPFEVRIVVLGKRLDALEGRLLVLYITDRYAYDTLLQQEHYTEVAHSTSVRFLDGKDVYLEFSGNLVPVTKSGSQPMLSFEAFKDNRVEFTVRVKHHEESPSGRIYFMNEPKVAKGEQSQTPACVLDVELPERIAPRAGKSQVDYLNLDQSGFDALKDELSFHWGDHNHSVGPPSLPDHNHKPLNGHDKIITNGDVKYSDTKDQTDKDYKPQVNGDGGLHVDSNKVKATFDSDEDKTPMNTLEKGKKKSEGFFGGLTDKVKNVFKHDDSEEKESSPKPQPKPRDSKEKSPPKPAPRIINEDLLGKVDDMFKDLKTIPGQKDSDEVQEQVYTTKLVVDEGDRPLNEITEELYDQYAQMQPVETPLRQKVKDPFQFPKCCDGKKYKHTHDETSNIVDIIEQTEFAAHEKLNEAGDRLSSELHDGLSKNEEEIGNVIQKTDDMKNDLAQFSDKLKGDLIITEDKIKTGVQNKFNDAENKTSSTLEELSKDLQTTHKDVSAKASEIQSNIATEFDTVKSSTGDVLNSIGNTIKISKDELKSNANVVDFAARERAEQLYLGGQNVQTIVKTKVDDVKHNTEAVGNDLKNKTHDVLDSVAASIHDVKKNIDDKVEDFKTDVKETTENIKDVTNEKVSGISESIENTKQKSKKEAKKKAKEGKNFFTGFVSNIFGEKDKIEEGVKGKISKSKEAANDVLDEALSKKDEVEEELSKKQNELKKGAEDLAQSVKDKKNKAEKVIEEKEATLKQGADDLLQNIKDDKHKVEKAINDKADEVKDAINSKKDEAKAVIVQKTKEVEDTIKDKKKEISTAVHDKTDEAQKEFQNKKDLVVNFIETEKEAVLDKISESKQAFVDKKNEVEGAIVNKKDDISADVTENTNKVIKSVEEKKSEVENSIKSTKDAVVGSVKENTENAKQALENTKVSVKDFALSKTDDFSNAVQDTKEQVENFVQNKTEDLGKAEENFVSSINEKSNDAKKAVLSKKDEMENAILSKKDEIENMVSNKKDEVQNATASELDRIRQEAEVATEQIKKTAEDALNTASEKKTELQKNISNKVGDVKQATDQTIGAAANATAEIKSDVADKIDSVKVATKDQFENLHKAASEKAGDLQRSAQQTFDHIQDSTLSSFDKIESSAKDKVSDAKDTWEDLQSSTRDTYADFKDDVHSLGSSAQDTLHSFQSSAGNTFDSLDDSAREFIGGVQNTASEAADYSSDVFGHAKDSFEGFQVSANNKLEDVRGSAKNKIDEAGARLGEAAEDLSEGVRETEQVVGDAVLNEADKFTSSLNDLGNSVFGSSGKGFMKDSSTKLLESEKSQSSPSPHKKGSGIPKLKRKK